MAKSDNNELDKAMTLYGALTFENKSIQTYLEGYLTALDRLKIKNEIKE